MDALPNLSALGPRPAAAVGVGVFRLSVFDDPAEALPSSDESVAWVVERKREPDFPPRRLEWHQSKRAAGTAVAVQVQRGKEEDRRIQWETEEQLHEVWLRLTGGDTLETTSVFENFSYAWGPRENELFKPAQSVSHLPPPAHSSTLAAEGGPMLLSLDDGQASRLLECTAVAFARNTILGVEETPSLKTIYQLPEALMVVRLRDPETGLTLFGVRRKVRAFGNQWSHGLGPASPMRPVFLQRLRETLLSCPAFGLPALARHFESAPGGARYGLAAVSWGAGLEAQSAQQDKESAAGAKRARGP